MRLADGTGRLTGAPVGFFPKVGFAAGSGPCYVFFPNVVMASLRDLAKTLPQQDEYPLKAER